MKEPGRPGRGAKRERGGRLARAYANPGTGRRVVRLNESQTVASGVHRAKIRGGVAASRWPGEEEEEPEEWHLTSHPRQSFNPSALWLSPPAFRPFHRLTRTCPSLLLYIYCCAAAFAGAAPSVHVRMRQTSTCAHLRPGQLRIVTAIRPTTTPNCLR
jgi:hypothetical protein